MGNAFHLCLCNGGGGGGGEMGNIEVEGPGAPEPKDELQEYGPCFNGF